MKSTLRSRLIKWFSSRPNEVISGGEMERMVSVVTTYKPSTISRRLREICENGLIVATYEKGTVFYQWATQKNGYVGEFLGYTKEPLSDMAKVQLTLV